MTYVMTLDPIRPRTVGTLAVSPLRLALLQVRTTPVLALERPEAVEQVVGALGGGWTLTDRQANREVAVQVGPEGVRQQAGSPETVWVLSSESGNTRAALSASSVAVETESYERWDVFGQAIGEVLNAVSATLAPKRCVRLGMRYINELDVSRADADPHRLAEQVNPALVAPAIALDRPVASSFTELRTVEDDGAVFALRHGLVNTNTYLLDFDAYREGPEDFDPAELTNRAEGFHGRIESVFAWALTDDYLHELRGEDEAVS